MKYHKKIFRIAMETDKVNKSYFKEVEGEDISNHPLIVKSFSPLARNKLRLFVHFFSNEIEGGYHVSSARNGIRITNGYAYLEKYMAIEAVVKRIKRAKLKRIYKSLDIPWYDNINIIVGRLLKEDYSKMPKRLCKPDSEKIKSSIGNAIEFIDGKTGKYRNGELLQAMKYYAVAVMLTGDKKQQVDALSFFKKSKDIWCKYRKY